MYHLEKHQIINLVHILVIAPALWIALSPKLMSRFKLDEEMTVKIVKYVIIGMVIVHLFRFLSGFDFFKGLMDKMVKKPSVVIIEEPKKEDSSSEDDEHAVSKEEVKEQYVPRLFH
jgi:hypothetical protein